MIKRERYQGKEQTSILQAPTEKELNSLIGSSKVFTKSQGMETFQVLQKGKDPDGGYRAVIASHNFNPIKWIGEKVRRKKPEEEEDTGPKYIGPATAEGAWEETERVREEAARRLDEERTARGTAEDTARKWEFKEKIRGKQKTREEQTSPPPPNQEDILSKFSGRERKKIEKRLQEAKKAKAYADIEIMESGIPEKVKSVQKIWQQGYWISNVTGATIPEPRTAAERREASYHPPEYRFIEVNKPLSSMERLATARAMRGGAIELGLQEAKYKQFKREQSRPYKAARGAVEAGKTLTAVSMLAAAGTAKSLQPGRGGPKRAANMFAPSVPLDLYAVKPVLGVGMPRAKDLTGAGLGHLREATLPRVGRRPRGQE